MLPEFMPLYVLGAGPILRAVEDRSSHAFRWLDERKDRLFSEGVGVLDGTFSLVESWLRERQSTLDSEQRQIRWFADVKLAAHAASVADQLRALEMLRFHFQHSRCSIPVTEAASSIEGQLPEVVYERLSEIGENIPISIGKQERLILSTVLARFMNLFELTLVEYKQSVFASYKGLRVLLLDDGVQ